MRECLSQHRRHATHRPAASHVGQNVVVRLPQSLSQLRHGQDSPAALKKLRQKMLPMMKYGMGRQREFVVARPGLLDAALSGTGGLAACVSQEASRAGRGYIKGRTLAEATEKLVFGILQPCLHLLTVEIVRLQLMH